MKRRLWELSALLVPRRNVFDFNQALMDFGALLCVARKPKCLVCPMSRMCRAYPWNPENEAPRPPHRSDELNAQNRQFRPENAWFMVVLLPCERTLAWDVMPPRPLAEASSSRSRLLKAAKRLFATQGYEQTATSAIAREAGTSESQLMRYFGGKVGLLDALFNDAWGHVNDRVRRAVAGAADSRDAILAVLQTMTSAFARDPDLATLLLFEGRRLRGDEPRIRVSEGFARLRRYHARAGAKGAGQSRDRRALRRRRRHIGLDRRVRGHDSRSDRRACERRPGVRRSRDPPHARGDGVVPGWQAARARRQGRSFGALARRKLSAWNQLPRPPPEKKAPRAHRAAPIASAVRSSAWVRPRSRSDRNTGRPFFPGRRA